MPAAKRLLRVNEKIAFVNNKRSIFNVQFFYAAIALCILYIRAANLKGKKKCVTLFFALSFSKSLYL